MAKRVIFSDLHFGDPACSLNRKPVAEGLRSFLSSQGRVKELIFAGDILDANISSLTRAIEGIGSSGAWPKEIGFRRWLSYLFDSKFDAEKIVYIPGNHDYIIWNILSTDKAFTQPISKGEVPTNLPLMEATFSEPFVRGLAPEKIRERFVAIYPEYEFDLSGRSVLVTHGHYLDEKQTLFKNLKRLIREENGNEAKAIRKFFIGTAQYQAVANSVSYMKGTREFVDKVHKGLSAIFDIIGVIGNLRDKPIDAEMLAAIEMYLHYFRKKKPDVFIFGHTHEAGHSNTGAFGRTREKRLIEKVIDVWNDGGFIKSPLSSRAGTFIITDDAKPGGSIKLFKLDSKGDIEELSD